MTPPATLTPEQEARVHIDRQLEQSGWEIRNPAEMNIFAAQGVAVREVKLKKDTSLDSALESFNIKANAFNPLPDLKTATSRDFKGKSEYEKTGNFEARISVTVKDVLPNGNLVVEGRRNIYKDDEEQVIKITGIVRLFDISTENTVASEKVSNAKVSYDGKGPMSHTTERNWLDNLLDLFWPF